MKGGEWIWILVAAFGLFRLLMLARKKKAGGNRPPPEVQPGRGPVPARQRTDPLKAFIDSLTDRADYNAMPGEGIPPQPEEFSPPADRKPPPVREPSGKPPRAIPLIPVPAEIAPVKRRIGASLNFSRNPVIQGIIFSEILGPPRGLGGGSRLPSDPPT